MICPKCGVLLPDNVTACGHCGCGFSGSETGPADNTTKTPPFSDDADPNLSQATQLSAPDRFPTVSEPKPIFGWLVVIEGEDLWREFLITQENRQYLIGKSTEHCAFRLRGNGVENMHASLRLKDEKLFITDLDTEDGAYLNDEPVTREEVKDGDRIRIGDVILKFRKF